MKKNEKIELMNAYRAEHCCSKREAKEAIENQITDTKKRQKGYGEVMTPPALVNEMLDHFGKYSNSAFWNSGKTFLDPTCGHGNFLVEILRRKLNANVHPYDALQSIFGVEIQLQHVLVTRYRLLKVCSEMTNFDYPNDPIAIGIVCGTIKLGDALKDNLGDEAFYYTPSISFEDENHAKQMSNWLTAQGISACNLPYHEEMREKLSGSAWRNLRAETTIIEPDENGTRMGGVTKLTSHYFVNQEKQFMEFLSRCTAIDSLGLNATQMDHFDSSRL